MAVEGLGGALMALEALERDPVLPPFWEAEAAQGGMHRQLTHVEVEVHVIECLRAYPQAPEPGCALECAGGCECERACEAQV